MNKHTKYSVPLLTVIVLLFSLCYSAPTNHEEIPEDVKRFKSFLQEFDKGEIRLLPTLQLLQGRFPLAFQEIESQHQREKREVEEESESEEEEEPVLTEGRGTTESGTVVVDEDDSIKQYVRNEINRIFSCYQRLRCGYSRAQAEQECKWLEHSSLYHQLMRMMGIKNYPKKRITSPGSSSAQGPPSQRHAHRGQEQQQHGASRRNSPPPPSSPSSDVAINPLHQNLQNGIRYGGVRHGQYNASIALSRANRNRRYYDSFWDTKNEPVSSVSNPVQS